MKKRGFTLVEVLVGTAIFAVFALGVYQGFAAVYAAMTATQEKTLAADLANERFEIVRNMAYENVGVIGGNPSGLLSATSTVVRDRVTFIVTTAVVNVDDPFDGSGAGDPFPRDYKLVEMNVACDGCKNFTPLVFTGRVAPKGLES